MCNSGSCWCFFFKLVRGRACVFVSESTWLWKQAAYGTHTIKHYYVWKAPSVRLGRKNRTRRVRTHTHWHGGAQRRNESIYGWMANALGVASDWCKICTVRVKDCSTRTFRSTSDWPNGQQIDGIGHCVWECCCFGCSSHARHLQTNFDAGSGKAQSHKMLIYSMNIQLMFVSQAYQHAFRHSLFYSISLNNLTNHWEKNNLHF